MRKIRPDRAITPMPLSEKRLTPPLAPIHSILCWFAWLLLWGPIADLPADTIVLKNGRRIVAEAVTEQGDKVFYEGEFGRVTIPRAIVERIEKGGAVPARQTPPATATLSKDQLTGEISTQLQLPVQNMEVILHDGAVDDKRLEALASLADRGGLELQNAVNAYLLAAAFEARQKRLAEASRWAEEALRLSASDRNALLLAAQIDLGRRQYSEALNHLLIAQSLAPDSPDVLILLGYAAYFTEGAERAAWYWKQADALRPDPQLKERIRQAEQEAQLESGLEQSESYHFVLSWEGAGVPSSFGREVLETLERQYRELEIALDFSPREPVAVVLYPSQQFQDITKVPGWAGAVNDGKIRVPVQGLTSVTAELAQVLKHEMVHSFVYQIAAGRCPTWFNEGLAQAQSGENLSQFGPIPARLSSISQQIPLARLEGSFGRFSPSQAAIAYAKSLAAVEMIRERYGDYQLPLLLKALREGRTMAQALQSVLRMSYEDLETELSADLVQRYGR